MLFSECNRVILAAYFKTAKIMPQKCHFFLPSMNEVQDESQNYRIVGAGRDLQRSSSPTPLPKQAPQTRLHRQVLNISREGESTTSLGSLFLCSVTLTVKKFSAHLCGTSYASVCGHFPLFCCHTPLKSLAPFGASLVPAYCSTRKVLWYLKVFVVLGLCYMSV